ncbi:hypothetical protein GLAREA_01523 [Glarea lozoyensis ATCC 20868]|uniref:Uncharacterized protein n=1 Tax=Glarea lozoyensis (strain ATCC 20868 / MF5171) TaxID=1116229 RepID=S3D0P6_GLAL2|nr:uncharacterized protein GLAREA_01523 [Glarea lozoyensis ATCC 20868]EPE25611.1 hypothetical protein GLAREA_01523 [Glarea lozoyensis ATCC 20868]
MSSSTSSVSQPISVPVREVKTRPRRSSKFIEGVEVTRPEILQQTPSSNEFLFTILSEMDAHEQQRKHRRQSHRGSNSSFESFGSSTAASPTTDFSLPKEKEGRRSLHFGRMSVDGRSRDVTGYTQGETETETIAKKVKGRLRAWTLGRDKDVKPYSGT